MPRVARLTVALLAFFSLLSVARPALAASPQISTVSPSTGSQAGGTTVTISGYNLSGATIVRFGSVYAKITYVSTTGYWLKCTAPASLGQKTVNVTVVTPGGSWTKFGGFSYADPSPALSSVTPASANVGTVTTVTLTGSSFLKVGTAIPSVTVGSLSATVTWVSSSSLTVAFPDDSAGKKDVTVTNPDGKTTTLLAVFERTTPPPPPTDPIPDESNLGFLPAPLTIRAVGVYLVSTGGEARLDMSDVTNGLLALGGRTYGITGDVTKGTLAGIASATTTEALSRVAFTIQKKNVLNYDGITVTIVTGLNGTKDGLPLTLTRKVPNPVTNAELGESDPGAPAAFQSFFATCPDYAETLKLAGVDPLRKMFWYDFGALFYRGRLDGTARVMVIASDPGPEECLPFVRRPMVGDAGQRVQGFLAKLGIDRSYVLVNAYAYAMRPTYVNKGYGRAILTETFTSVSPVITLTDAQKAELHKITVFRNEMFTRVARSSPLSAIVPMGDNAQKAYSKWMASLAKDDPLRKIPHVNIVHPSAVDRNPMGPRPDSAITGWRAAITKLRAIVKPDPGQSNAGINYGEYFTENDYVRVPRRDLGWRTPLNVGNNAHTRQVTGDYNDAHRPSPDDFKSLIYVDPSSGRNLRYVYLLGVFHPELTTDEAGKLVAVDADGIPTN